MTGPLAQQFAQVREGMVYRRGGESTYAPIYPNCTCPDCLALRALSVIERHVQDMEKALEERWKELINFADESDGTGEHVGFARYYRAKAEGVAEAQKLIANLATRAALPPVRKERQVSDRLELLRAYLVRNDAPVFVDALDALIGVADAARAWSQAQYEHEQMDALVDALSALDGEEGQA